MQETQEIAIFDSEPRIEDFNRLEPIIQSGRVYVYAMCNHCKPFYCEKCEEIWTTEEKKMMKGIKA